MSAVSFLCAFKDKISIFIAHLVIARLFSHFNEIKMLIKVEWEEIKSLKHV